MFIETKEPRIAKTILEENEVDTLHYVTSTLLSYSIKIRM